MRALPSGCLLALLLVASASPSAADDPVKFEAGKFLEAKAPSVVTVKSVLKVGDSERNDERTGSVVDPEGVVMLVNWTSTRFRSSSAFKMTPTKIRVLFDGDEKEYDAVLGATDSKLGLAFVRVKDLAGKKPTSVDFAAGTEVKLGDELAGVVRTDQGFDYAPYYGVARIVGQVTKPRSMWIVSGFIPEGHPLYTMDGRAAGVVVRQVGATDDAASRIFLLPAKAVTGVISEGVKRCAKAVEEAKTQDAEAAAEAAMGEPAPSPAPAGPGMGEPPAGMDGGMDAGK